MSTLEQDLTEAMAAFAEGAPDDLGLLSRVQAGSRRRARNRRIGLAVGVGALAAAVAVVAVGPVSVPRAQNRYADPTGFLVDSRDLELRFPLTPSFLPPGLDPSPRLEETGHYGTASYLLGGRSALQVRISHYETRPPMRGADTTVDGTPATITCHDVECSLGWQRAPGLFVVVSVTAPGGDPTVLAHQVAQGLRDEPIVHRPHLVLGLTPAKGCLLNDPVGLSTSMNPVDLGGPRQACPVSAAVYAPDELGPAGFAEGTGTATTVGGYAGWLDQRSAPAQWVAVLKLNDGRRLVVLTPSSSPWTRAGLDRFVRAIIVPTG